MLKVKDIAQCRDYKYLNSEDNYRISDTFYWRLEEKVKQYRKANNYPIGSNWSEQFEANVCANSPGVCVETKLPSPRVRAASVVRAAVRWAKAGFKTRTHEEAEAILENFCRKCEHYGGEKGLLRIACRLCGCSSKKTYLATEHCPKHPPLW